MDSATLDGPSLEGAALEGAAVGSDPQRGVRAEGFAMQRGLWECLASLRCFEGAGNVTAELAGLLGGPPPGVLQAVCYGDAGSAAEIVLAWRIPTETLLICSAARLADVESSAASRRDLCVVDQTGGIRVWTLRGSRVADLLMRLGSPSIIPLPGTSRIGRLAELTVLACCVRPQETLVIVDRFHEQHLCDWVRETSDDFR